MNRTEIVDLFLERQHIKHKYADFVWNSYLHKEIIEKILHQEFFGSLNSVVQLFLQYVIKEWACPNCLQTILPFMNNCYKDLPKNGDIKYVYSNELISKFPVLFCPHCDFQIVVIAINEYSELFEFRHKIIDDQIYDLSSKRALTNKEIEEFQLVKR